MRTEIDSPEELQAHLATGRGIAETVIQGLDLREHTDALVATPATGAVLLGCQLTEVAAAHVLASGGSLFPNLDNLPYRPFRPTLYDVEELMEGYRRGHPESFPDTVDQRIYAHFDALRTNGLPLTDALAQRLHDHAIDDALDDFLHAAPRSVVAIMGGHAMARGEPAYLQIARISQRLVQRGPRDVLMASGGGPGAMEATHLGAWLGRADDTALTAAVDTMQRAPGYRDPGWLDSAFEARDRGSPCESLAVPTWFYGHEPTNLFATHIAKYFSNSLREDGLLAIATRGVVYAPGSAGTVQEVFMDAAQNHYGTFGVVSPMVFFGERYWSEEKPVLPLLRALAGSRQYSELIRVTDEVDEVVRFIAEHPPVQYTG